jgi:predicted ATPase/DNA-binding SARP family transcriptional activator
MAPTAQIQLLGDFRLTWDDRPAQGITTPRLQSLLAYLALHRDAPQLRQRIAFIFWPDSSEAQARNNLRQLLHALRGAQPDLGALLLVEHHALQWRPDVTLRLDVEAFEQAAAELERDDTPPDSGALRLLGERILELYQGDLLPGCYDDWIAPERERLRERYIRTLERLMAAHEAQRNLASAIRYARELIRSDPLNEEAHRALMRLLAQTGDRAGELRAYQAGASALLQALGIGPSQATEELHQSLLQMAPPLSVRRDQPAPIAKPSVAPLAAPSALIGRQREWQTLQAAWQAACAHGPGFVLITGEPGIGKSRLAEELVRSASQQGVITATARSYAVEGRLSFAPVIEWLRSPGLRPAIRRLDPLWLSELARVLPELVAEHPETPPYAPLTEFGQRQQFFRALALATLAAPQPLLLVMDDLQWCDQETLEWLHFLERFDPSARLLVVGAARTEETPPQHPLRVTLNHLRHTVAVTEIALGALDAAETAELAARIVDRELDASDAMRLFGETEGNPLFVIETARAGLEKLLERRVVAESDAVAPIPDTETLPPGVRAVIASRLAQLSPPARELAALAAIVGRACSIDVLTQVSHVDEEHIVSALDELWQRRIVREHGTDTYDFTHDKLREVAYAEISAPQRRLLHRRVAQTLASLHADDLDAVSGQIAAHYEAGGAIAQAIPAYHRAALVAQRVFAFEDAIQLLRHCLALLEQTPSGAARDQQDLRLLLALAPLYRITRGWTAPELEVVIDRTLALCEVVGDDTQRAEALYSQQSLHVVQSRLEGVEEVAHDLHAIYERSEGAPPPHVDMMLAGAQMHLGRLSEAGATFGRILHEGDSLIAQQLQQTQGWNFAVLARAWGAHALWLLGFPERAARSGQDAVGLAQSMGQPFNQALAATYLATLWQIGSDAATASALAAEALRLSKEYKAPYYEAWAAILVNAAQADECPDEEHISALRDAIAAFMSSGARLRLPYYFSLLARVYLQAGRPDDGLLAIGEALAHATSHNERWWDAELHRLRAELTLAVGRDPRDAEADLLRAVEIARGQQARSLELRALRTLARLPGSRRAESQRELRVAYAWFTEGFDTPDLRAARADVLLHQKRRATPLTRR